ncbi:hypothetical protein GCM10010211_15240 [Streptomyces albospinus]|uniref:Uncharacterized protein n=1 Tax=Streptomyces albospinus TaxID=285515 RepID=A0ABQ2USI1_9ACTN|nr:hypothetical protein [Streptomyces albospinus]GGU51507.1 hypothetical protein GCM10010211_15240 [Streptomyces albospinus]
MGTQEELTAIQRLWADYRLPILDALHFADGRSFEVEIDPDVPSGMRVQEQFDLEEVLAEDPDWTTRVDGLRTVPLGDGGVLWGGDGATGSNGFFARLHADLTLVWVIFFQVSNPFCDIRLSGTTAEFRSTSGVAITVDIDDPTRSGPA